MDFEEYFKAILEALHLSISKRISITIGLGGFILIKFGADFFQRKKFFDFWTALLTLIMILTLVTAFADIYDNKKKAKDAEIKKISEKRQKDKEHNLKVIQDRLNEARYRKYILTLSGRKLEMVKKLYLNEHGRGFLPDVDVNTTDLLLHNVIISTNKGKYVTVPSGDLDEQHEKYHLYVLTPQAKKVIDNNYEKFFTSAK